MPNMKVADAEYNSLSEAIRSIGTTAEENVSEYFSILDTILSNAVQEGEVHTALRSFATQAASIKGIIGDLCNEIAGDCTNYVSEVDEKDQYLY